MRSSNFGTNWCFIICIYGIHMSDVRISQCIEVAGPTFACEHASRHIQVTLGISLFLQVSKIDFWVSWRGSRAPFLSATVSATFPVSSLHQRMYLADSVFRAPRLLQCFWSHTALAAVLLACCLLSSQPPRRNERTPNWSRVAGHGCIYRKHGGATPYHTLHCMCVCVCVCVCEHAYKILNIVD